MSNPVHVDARRLTAEQQGLVEEHLPLVTAIASRWRRRCRNAADHDELIQAGALGLIDAAFRFDPARGPFHAIASRRIQGAMGDHLRAIDPLSRDKRGAVRAFREATSRLEAELGREPMMDEIARVLGWEVDAVESARGDVAALGAGWAQVLDPSSCDDIVADGGRPGATSALAALLDAEMTDQVEAALEGLSERERLVLDLYYRQELMMHEVGEVLGVTESRVSQIRSAAIARLRTLLGAPAASTTATRQQRSDARLVAAA